VLFLSCAFLLGALLLAPGAGAYVYWVNMNSIGRANLDGTGVDQNFIPSASNGECGMAVDAAHIYWTYGNTAIARANLDGSEMNLSFITGGNNVCGVAVDGSHIYWGNQGSNSVGRANLDGSGPNQKFISSAPGACGPAVGGGHLYWANFGTGGNGSGTTIGRADLDAAGNASNVKQNFITGATGPCFVALDASHIYWENLGLGTGIARANLDGSGVDQSFFTVPSGPCGLAVDGSHVWWAHLGGGLGTEIGRSSLDGSVIEPNFIDGSSQPCGVAVDGLPFPPANQFSFGKVKHNQKNGTVMLPVNVPGPGTLTLTGKGLKHRRPARAAAPRSARTVKAAGRVKLLVRAKGKAAKRLRRHGKVKVTAKVTFTPTGGSARTKTKKLKLIRRRH
jgi:hypothetical protein